MRRLTKEFDLSRDRRKSIKESFIKIVQGQENRSSTIVRVLDNVTFSINKSDMVGIVGQNGAGKSTLLKLLAGIYRPTSGDISISGTIASILEVGVGFHPELTGIENAILYGGVLGINRKQMKSMIPEIEEFSGLRGFMELPLRKYSSGMQMRLAFSVASSLDPDLLLLDEVFAVGDHDFQFKSQNRILSFLKKGKGIVLVSHDWSLIANICTRVLFVSRDGLVTELTPTELVYLNNERGMMLNV